MAKEDRLISMCSECKMQWILEPEKIPQKEYCERCGSKVIHTPITPEEMFLIERTSKERTFINAMIDLKKKDIIEFQMKISQMRAQAKADDCYDKPKPKCPKCGCTEFVPLRKKWSLFSGFATNKVDMVCKNCGAMKK